MYIDHIAIWTRDLEAVKDFYLRYFKCTAGEKYVNPLKRFSSYFITFESGSGIELMKREDIETGRAGETLGITHIAINVGSREQVNAMTERFEKDGHIIAGRPRVTGDGYYESVVVDPEENRIEIVG